MALPNYYYQYRVCLIFMMMMMVPSMVGWAYAAKNRIPSDDENPSSSSSKDNNTMLSSHDMNQEVLMLERHQKWTTQYGREYKDDAEKEIRFKIFKQNVEYIESVNLRGDRSYKLGINQFTDRTLEELQEDLGCDSSNPSEESSKDLSNRTTSTLTSSFTYPKVMEDPPESIDWREAGAIGPVRDQGHCGSCWALSAVEATQAAYQIKYGDLPILSAQQLVDCDRKRNQGCIAGNPSFAYEDFIQVTGLTTEDDYPYKAAEETCRTDVATSITISGFTRVTKRDEQAIFYAVINQPVVARIQVGSRDFYTYKGGVFSGLCTEPNTNFVIHFVTIIGYGVDTEDSGKKYWLIKNNWGSGWGEGGYVRFERDINLCQIYIEAYYPYFNDE